MKTCNCCSKFIASEITIKLCIPQADHLSFYSLLSNPHFNLLPDYIYKMPQKREPKDNPKKIKKSKKAEKKEEDKTGTGEENKYQDGQQQGPSKPRSDSEDEVVFLKVVQSTKETRREAMMERRERKRTAWMEENEKYLVKRKRQDLDHQLEDIMHHLHPSSSSNSSFDEDLEDAREEEEYHRADESDDSGLG